MANTRLKRRLICKPFAELKDQDHPQIMLPTRTSSPTPARPPPQSSEPTSPGRSCSAAPHWAQTCSPALRIRLSAATSSTWQPGPPSRAPFAPRLTATLWTNTLSARLGHSTPRLPDHRLQHSGRRPAAATSRQQDISGAGGRRRHSRSISSGRRRTRHNTPTDSARRSPKHQHHPTRRRPWPRSRHSWTAGRPPLPPPAATAARRSDAQRGARCPHCRRRRSAPPQEGVPGASFHHAFQPPPSSRHPWA